MLLEHSLAWQKKKKKKRPIYITTDVHVFDSWLAEICRTWFPSLSQLNSYSLLILNIITYVYLSNYTNVKVSNLKPTPLSFHSLVFPNLSLFYNAPNYYYRLRAITLACA